jgi:hypothetical protein
MGLRSLSRARAPGEVTRWALTRPLPLPPPAAGSRGPGFKPPLASLSRPHAGVVFHAMLDQRGRLPCFLSSARQTASLCRAGGPGPLLDCCRGKPSAPPHIGAAAAAWNAPCMCSLRPRRCWIQCVPPCCSLANLKPTCRGSCGWRFLRAPKASMRGVFEMASWWASFVGVADAWRPCTLWSAAARHHRGLPKASTTCSRSHADPHTCTCHQALVTWAQCQASAGARALLLGSEEAPFAQQGP